MRNDHQTLSNLPPPENNRSIKFTAHLTCESSCGRFRFDGSWTRTKEHGGNFRAQRVIKGFIITGRCGGVPENSRGNPPLSCHLVARRQVYTEPHGAGCFVEIHAYLLRSRALAAPLQILCQLFSHHERAVFEAGNPCNN